MSRTTKTILILPALGFLFLAGFGVEVIVDIGVEIAAMVSPESAKMLELSCGKKACVSFKASAVKYIEE